MAVGRINSAVHHGLHLLITGEGFLGRIVHGGYRITYPGIPNILNGSGKIAYHTRSQLISRNKLSRSKGSHLCYGKLRTGGHKANIAALFNASFLNSTENDNPSIAVIEGVKYQCLKGILRTPFRCGKTMHHRFQYFFHIQTGFCGNLRCIHRFKTDYIFNFMGNQFRVCRRQIHLIDNRDNFQIMIQGKISVGQGLSLNSLGSIHHQNSAIAGRQCTAYFIVKVHMPRGINEVKNIFLPVLCLIHNTNGLGFDGDTTLPLNVHIIQNLGLHLPFRKRSGFFYNTIRQS